MKKLLPLCICILAAINLPAQAPARPKLVVGLVVDQMRWDFLNRYADRYTANGFRRLLGEGFSCENAFIPYTPTYTAPGHASIYTGSVPALNGIIGNYWYDRRIGRNLYCTEDSTVTTVGSNSTAGQMSPLNLWSSTMTDELRLAGNFRGKTIGIALKDRGAILPAGHTANAAYWFDNASGGWISSSFYMKQLPGWVEKFNAMKRPDAFLKQNWNTIFPVESYRQSTTDNKPYETPLTGGDNRFLHRTDTVTRNKYELFRYTPYGNTYSFEMAMAAIQNEGLGRNGFTDFLALSLSSTDYIGHNFGPNSIEMEDTYLRLDRDLGAFLQYLDQKIGKGNYLLFLTSDHGVAHVPGFAKEARLPAGNMSDDNLRRQLNEAVRSSLQLNNTIARIINYQVYLDDKAITSAGGNREAVKSVIIRELMRMPAIIRAFDLEAIEQAGLPEDLNRMVRNGYNQKFSGDIQYVFRPNWFDWGGSRGTTHGSSFPYDAHIPMVFFGWNIKPGKLYRKVYMTDIAPTISALLKIQMPNAAVGTVLPELMK